MANPLFESMQPQQNGPFGMLSNLQNQINQLKSSGITDPNKKIQEMLNSGQISQQDYDAAVQKANYLKMMFGRK